MLRVVLENGVDPHDPDAYICEERHSAASRLWPWLTRLAEDNGLTPLTAFYNLTAADIEGYVDFDDIPTDLPPVEWFDAAAGLAAVRSVIVAVARAEVAPERQRLLTELALVESGIALAVRSGVRFRLTMLL